MENSLDVLWDSHLQNLRELQCQHGLVLLHQEGKQVTVNLLFSQGALTRLTTEQQQHHLEEGEEAEEAALAGKIIVCFLCCGGVGQNFTAYNMC